MVMHEIEATFAIKVDALVDKVPCNSNVAVDGLPTGVEWFRHFDGFTLTPWNTVVVDHTRITLNGLRLQRVRVGSGE